MLRNPFITIDAALAQLVKHGVINSSQAVEVMERVAMANGADASEAKHAREFLATTRESEGESHIGFISLPPRTFVPVGQGEPPEGRREFMAGNIEAVWAPEYRQPDADASFAELARGPQLQGWWVNYHYRTPWCDCQGRIAFEPMYKGLKLQHDLFHKECGRAARNKRGNLPIGEHIGSLQIQAMSDEAYNGHYPTLPGHDVAHFTPGSKPGTHGIAGGKVVRARDGQPIRGGREISHGRREYKSATKDFLGWDKGTQKDIDRNAAERKAKEKQAVGEVVKKESFKWSRRLRNS